MKYLWAILLFIVMGCCCAHKEMHVRETPVATPAVISFHADKAFTPTERRDLLAAAQEWKRATNGLATILISFDLDMWSPSGLAANVTEDLILRIEHDNPRVSANGKWDGTWGLAPPLGGIHARDKGPIRFYMVADRTGPAGIFLPVAIHEMGHALGLHHIQPSESIMYRHCDPDDKDKPACLTSYDLQEFCRVNDCGTVKMNPCERD